MTRPLRLATGVLFAPDSTYRVGGFVSYSARFLRALAERRGIRVTPLVEPVGDRLPAAELTAPHLFPFSKQGERLIAVLERALRAASPDVVHVMEWGSTGMALFEACIRVGVPYSVLVIDHKPVCSQAMLLERGRDVCDGPTSLARCDACLKALGWRYRTPAILGLRHAALAYYFRRAAAVIAFTPQHADEVARWLGRPRETIDVVPIAVPPAGAAYRKAPDAFTGPLRLGFIARCVPEWGLELTLEAWRLLDVDPSRAVLDIRTSKEFAEEGLDERYADLIASGSITVDLEPVFERLDEVHADLAALIVASAWKNNISGAGLEALERGTPVITSDRYAFYESLSPELKALAYRFGDAASLAAVLARVIDDPSLLAARSADPPPAWSEDDHVAGIEAVLRRVAGTPVGPTRVQALPVDGAAAAVVVARGRWRDALDAYLAEELTAPGGGLVLVGDIVGFEHVEAAVLERLDVAGIAPEDCPPLTLMESLDPLGAVPAAAVLWCGPDGVGADAAACCGVPVERVGVGQPRASLPRG